jgi:hypothetical protein
MNPAHQKLLGTDMPDIERTAAGFQTVIPGCEKRMLPKSTSAADDAGQGLLEFYRPPTLREKLATRADAPLQPRRRQGR